MRSKTLEVRAAEHKLVIAGVEKAYEWVIQNCEDAIAIGYCHFSLEGLDQSAADLLRDKLETEGFTVTHVPSSKLSKRRKELRIEWMDSEEILL